MRQERTRDVLGSAFHIRHSSDATALHSPEPRPKSRPKSRLATYLQAQAQPRSVTEGGYGEAGVGEKYFNKLATLDLIDFHFE